jgi:membrane-bound serine protease (ClpP class)
LPVNWFGLIFLATAFVLFYLDVHAPTHGALTLAGTGSLIMGALVLFNSPGTPPEFRVSIPLVVGVSGAIAITFGLFVSFAVRALRAPQRMDSSARLLGRTGIVRSSLAPVGTVQVGSELWSAELEPKEQLAERGARVEVVQVTGNRLLVRRLVEE